MIDFNKPMALDTGEKVTLVHVFESVNGFRAVILWVEDNTYETVAVINSDGYGDDDRSNGVRVVNTPTVERVNARGCVRTRDCRVSYEYSVVITDGKVTGIELIQ